MKALITGITGFVAKYLAQHLIKEGYEVWGTTRQSSPVLFNNIHGIETVDLNSSEQVLALINRVKPDYIFHLAGRSSVKESWINKVVTFEANVLNTINLLEAVKNSVVADNVRVLTVGSSEEYGDVNDEKMPITESTPLRPISPYGISKTTVGMLAQHYNRAYSLGVIHVRPFNHIGPGQSLGFVTTDFAMQVARIEANLEPPTIKVGNLMAKRDFTDVRDIARAYSMIIKNGNYGEVYNVCSGKAVQIGNILDYYVSKSHINIKIEKNDDLLRKVDFPLYIGSNEKLKGKTQWDNSITLQASLNDILDHCRENITKEVNKQ